MLRNFQLQTKQKNESKGKMMRIFFFPHHPRKIERKHLIHFHHEGKALEKKEAGKKIGLELINN